MLFEIDDLRYGTGERTSCRDPQAHASRCYASSQFYGPPARIRRAQPNLKLVYPLNAREDDVVRRVDDVFRRSTDALARDPHRAAQSSDEPAFGRRQSAQ